MPAPEIIHQLVAKFNENREAYRSGKYNEARLRQEFLDQFFIALGWDVYNTKGAAPQYADVEIETSLDIEGTSKSPDYTFRVGPERKFFVEAKKPAVNIQYDIHPAYQLKRYAWNAHLPISILTDFEEFAVYNCKQKPNPSDSPAAGRELFIKFTEYIERWDEIAGIFSREAVWKGALDRYADTSKGKKGTTEVDDEFLKDMNEWRLVLARNIALRNMQIADEQQLNYAVQMTLDRIIFLRICEDRGIEPEEQLKTLCATPGVYPRLLELFRHADLKYNSGLFNFTHDKNDNTPPDTFTPALAIDDRVLKEIIHGLYYPCPYIFKEIPVEILGQVYEQFLGQVIRLTAGHQAKVEEKPEVRKAGGVYYTPKYIVDYIVANTVGKLLEGRTPAEAAALKIVDPACGSGSFLLGAFQYLIDWHEKWYLDNDPAKWTRGKAPALNEVTNGYRLTTLKKKEILLNNLHGVDIDAQAVEVTKLSLLLKVLEEESGQLSLGLERALPDLGRNIQCGNSLIGEDYFAGQLVVDPAERRRVNPFDWERAFPQVFSQGGFDAVIGNPPYVFGRDWNSLGISDDVKAYFKRKYKSVIYQMDMFSLFMEQASFLAKFNGFIGQIVPNVWMNNVFSSETRKLILQQAKDLLIYKPEDVFQGITVDTVVYTYEKNFKSIDFFYTIDFDQITKHSHIKNKYLISNFIDGKNPITTSGKAEFLYRIKDQHKSLSQYAHITRGVHPYRTGGYGRSAFGNYQQTQRDVEERPYNSKIKLEGYRGFIYGKDLSRFTPPNANDYIKYGNWLAEPRKPEFFVGSRVYSRKILGERLVVTVEDKDSIADQQVYISLPKDVVPDAYFLAGILGSKFLGYYIKNYYDEMDKNFPQIKVGQLASLPIPFPDQKMHAIIHLKVLHMLELHKQAKSTPQEQEQLRREIESTDRQIDQLVYQLYGLTDEEIRIVEGSN
ncbi:MAG TPA: TaqI-like C-terminal specificity domain-containing protein [Anaerolineaceae bacterium]|nr:TaqI-like C-terminal specificity domain-containing protein [Anaerolineaceae bacterium]